MTEPADPASDAGRFAAWVARTLPGARDVGVTPLPRAGTTGFSADTLLFDLAWTDGAGRHSDAIVVRRAPLGPAVFPVYDVAREHRLLEALAGTDVPVPPLRWLEEDARALGAPFYVMARIEGRIPTDNPPYHVGGWVTEIAPAERARLWWSGIDVLARIHRLDWRALDLGFVASTGRGSTPFERQLDDWERFLGWAWPRGDHPTCTPALAWLRANRPPPGEPVALCWGDARPGNMIFRDGRCVAVLDWEMATLGNPEQDLAWWLFLDRHHSEGLGAPRLPGFPSHADTVARWEALTGRRAAQLPLYEVFAALRFAAVMIRVAACFEAAGVLPAGHPMPVDNSVTRLLAKQLGLAGPGG